MNHEFYMRHALSLAQKGWPAVAPNPLVGCVIVKHDRIVASGYHERFGGPHAEVNAINALPQGVNPAECTLYVTLEPCSHYGKTPPCANKLVEMGFGTVVVACQDPNPLVQGKGINLLRSAGIEVITDVCAEEARYLNRRFFTFHEKKRPYIIIKWAQSADGYIARKAAGSREENIISGPDSQKMVHQLRAENMAILVGKNTAISDNPRLTTRLVSGRNPLRVLLDRNLEAPPTLNIFDRSAPTVVFNGIKEGVEGNITFVKSEGRLEEVLHWLHANHIQSLIVEGGSRIITSFLEEDLWDEVLVFQNPHLLFGAGVKAPMFPLRNTFEIVGNDKLYRHVRNVASSSVQAMAKEVF